MDGTAITFTLPAVATIVFNVAALVAIFFNMKGRVDQQDVRMKHLSERVEDVKVSLGQMESARGEDNERTNKLELLVTRLCERIDNLIESSKGVNRTGADDV